MSILSDYIILKSEDANKSQAGNGILTWYVGTQYYTNSRGPICDFSIPSAYFNVDLNNEQALMIESNLGFQNVKNTSNDSYQIVQLISDSGRQPNLSEHEVLKYRCPSRPNTISLRFSKEDNTQFDVSTNEGFFVCKFSYSNLEDNVQEFKDQQYV